MLRSAFFMMTMPFVVFGSIGGWIFLPLLENESLVSSTGDVTIPSGVSAPKEEQP